MGFPQSNQQARFIGYPQNQLYNPNDLQYMQNAQRNFGDWGNWQPWMTNANQWVQSSDPVVQGAQQAALSDYFQRVGTPYEQTQRQGYWEQMGGQVYGGVIPPARNPITGVEDNPAYMPGTPWGDLNNMGVSTAYGMPAWQQSYFNSQNQGLGDVGSQAPIEQFGLTASGSTSNMSNYGIASDFSPAGDYTTQTLQSDMASQYPNRGDPPQQTPSAPNWMHGWQQSNNSWGSNNDSSRGGPWGNPSNWGSGWGR
jgi:hypothetical protein